MSSAKRPPTRALKLEPIAAGARQRLASAGFHWLRNIRPRSTARRYCARAASRSLRLALGIFASLTPAILFDGSGFCLGGLTLQADPLEEWTLRNPLPTGIGLSPVFFANDLFVAIGFSDPIWTSPDGITWTPRESGTTQLLSSVTYGNGTFELRSME